MDFWQGPCVDEVASLPLYCGALGFFSYEASRYFEPCLEKSSFNSEFWDYGFRFYDEVLVFDHREQSLYLCASSSNYGEAASKLKRLKSSVANSLDYEPAKSEQGRAENLHSNFSYDQYIYAIEKARDYIARGHSYQINLAQRLQCETTENPWQLYKKYTKINPVTYGAYFELGDYSIICGSPERLVKKKMESFIQDQLLALVKEAEHKQKTFVFRRSWKLTPKRLQNMLCWLILCEMIWVASVK